MMVGRSRRPGFWPMTLGSIAAAIWVLPYAWMVTCASFGAISSARFAAASASSGFFSGPM